MLSAFFQQHRLQTRIVAVYLGLWVLVQALSYGILHQHIDRNARQAVAESLVSGEALLVRLLEHQQDALQLATRTLADDASLQAALQQPQPIGLETALRSHGEAVRANIAVLTDAAFTPLARTEDDAGTATALAAMLQSLSDREATPTSPTSPTAHSAKHWLLRRSNNSAVLMHS